jgi:hypothetical protein
LRAPSPTVSIGAALIPVAPVPAMVSSRSATQNVARACPGTGLVTHYVQPRSAGAGTGYLTLAPVINSVINMEHWPSCS